MHNWFVVGCSVGSCSHSSHACDFKLWVEFLIVWLSWLLDCLTAFQFVIHFQNSLSYCSSLVFVFATLKDVWRDVGSFIYSNMCKILRYCRCGSKLLLLSTVIVPYRGPPWVAQVLPSVNLQLYYKTLWSALHFELALMAYEVEPSLPLPVASIAFVMQVLWHVNFCFQSSGMLFLLEQWYRISKESELFWSCWWIKILFS